MDQLEQSIERAEEGRDSWAVVMLLIEQQGRTLEPERFEEGFDLAEKWLRARDEEDKIS